MPRSSPNLAKPLKLSPAYTACLSADDVTLVTLSRDVFVWDVAKRVKRYRAHPLPHPSHCDFEPRGNHVAVKSTAGIIVTLDVGDGSVAQLIDGGTEGEGANILYSHCSRFIVDGSWKGSLTVRDAASGEAVFQRQREGEMIKRICADVARNRWAIHHAVKYPSERPDYVSLWTWPFRRPKCFELPEDVISALAMSPDGRLVATCSPCGKNTSRVTVRSVPDGGVVSEARLDKCDLVKEIWWSPNGTEFAVVRDQGFSFYKYPSFTLSKTVEMASASDLAYNSTGTWVVLVGWQGGMLVPWAGNATTSGGRAGEA